LDDADELARLRWQFRIEFGTPATMSVEAFGEQMRAFVADAFAGDAWRAWIAEDGGRPIGCVWLQLVQKVPHPGRRQGERPVGYLTSMYVEPDRRNSGLGRELLDVALAFARDRAVDGVLLWPSPDSVTFYERGGFAPGGWRWLEIAGD
jgi:GNAT superfamily N-acetyltransferase